MVENLLHLGNDAVEAVNHHGLLLLPERSSSQQGDQEGDRDLSVGKLEGWSSKAREHCLRKPWHLGGRPPCLWWGPGGALDEGSCLVEMPG